MKSTPKKYRGSALFTFIAGIVILVAVLFLLIKLAISGYHIDVADDAQTAVETRIQPVGQVSVGDGVAPGNRTGEQIFSKVCIQCHGEKSTVPGVPHFGNKAEWGPRIAQGLPTLLNHAIHGFNAMPARGGSPDLTDAEMERAIAYMANAGGANFKVAGPDGAASDNAAQDDHAATAAKSDAAPAEKADATPAAAAKAAGGEGQKVFEGLCIACHGANAAVPFAPHIGNHEQWAPRIKQGKATLFKHALEGFHGPDGGIMPAKGGNPTLTDDQIKQAVTYMVNQSGGKI